MAGAVLSPDARIVTRQQALDEGLNWYFDGTPCKKDGHVSKRRVVSYSCMACETARQKIRFEENRTELLQKSKNHYAKHRSKILERGRSNYPAIKAKKSAVAKLWREKNKESIAKRNRDDYTANKDRVLARCREWAANNREKKNSYMATRRARNSGAIGSHTSEDVARIKSLQKNKCAICKVSLKSGFEVDHIVPLPLGGGNAPANLQLLCMPCNRKKGHAAPEVFNRRMGLLL